MAVYVNGALRGQTNLSNPGNPRVILYFYLFNTGIGPQVPGAGPYLDVAAFDVRGTSLHTQTGNLPMEINNVLRSTAGGGEPFFVDSTPLVSEFQCLLSADYDLRRCMGCRQMLDFRIATHRGTVHLIESQ
jgi:hypothetical protein